jgi:hypothetical protein
MGASGAADGGTASDTEMERELERAMEQRTEGGGAGTSGASAPSIPMADLQRHLLGDSASARPPPPSALDDALVEFQRERALGEQGRQASESAAAEPANAAPPVQSGTTGGTATGNLSDYELQRKANIERNEGFLRELGLGDDERAPTRPRRPATAQPRAPRAPDGPPRSSARLRDAPRPEYADLVRSDESDVEALAALG